MKINKFHSSIFLLIFCFEMVGLGYYDGGTDKRANILQDEPLVIIMGPTSMPLVGIGSGLEAWVFPEQQGSYQWSIIQGADKAHITLQYNEYVWIEPLEVSDTPWDIAVQVGFTPDNQPGTTYYAEQYLTVFDVEVVNGDSCWSETPVVGEFFTGETKIYKAKIKPDSFQYDICEWVLPWSQWIIGVPDGQYCYVCGILPDYGRIEVHVQRYDSGGCATNYVDFGIYSANIQVNEKEESQEEATGLYIKKASMVQAKIGPSMLEMGSPEFVEMTAPQQIHFKIEAIEGSSKISLWEYDVSTGTYISRSFPYTYSCTPDPGNPFVSKTLYLKGEDTSSQTGDIKLIVKGYKISEHDSIAIDTVVITVFNIDVDWDPSYGLSEDAEKETGLYIPLNNDDDDADTTLDKDEHPVTDENDLMKLIIRKPQPSDLPGCIILSISNGADKVTMWDTAVKNNQIISKAYGIADDLRTDTYVWVEGYAKSSRRGCELQISYTAPDDATGIDTVRATVAKYRLRVYYHNDSCTSDSQIVDRVYPFVNDSISVRAILGTEALDGTDYFCGIGFDPGNSGQFFVNDGYWYCTATGGYQQPSGNWNGDIWPKLSPGITVSQWIGVPFTFSWYEIKSAVDKETTLSSVHKDTYNGNTRRFFYYPDYCLVSCTGWGFGPVMLNAGTHRYIVRVKRNDQLDQKHFLSSLEPIPGTWAEKTTDHIHPDYTLTWSQNCDEPPDTAGPTEYSVRISVRELDENTWPDTPIMRRYLQWLTSFLEVPYEWGGCWYGARADENGDITNEHDDYNGYGIDCSGLVSAAARFAGYNWSEWRTGTFGLAENYYSTLISNSNQNLRSGDILVDPGNHVVTVYHYLPGHLYQSDSAIIEANGGADTVRILEDVNIYYDYINVGYKPRRLKAH